MANTYRAVSDRATTLYGDKVFEADFTASDERDQLEAGHLEIVPRAYKVLSNNFAAAKQGETVDLALPVDNEAALVQGGHIERVDRPAKRTEKSTTEKKG